MLFTRHSVVTALVQLNGLTQDWRRSRRPQLRSVMMMVSVQVSFIIPQRTLLLSSQPFVLHYFPNWQPVKFSCQTCFIFSLSMVSEVVATCCTASKSAFDNI